MLNSNRCEKIEIFASFPNCKESNAGADEEEKKKDEVEKHAEDSEIADDGWERWSDCSGEVPSECPATLQNDKYSRRKSDNQIKPFPTTAA